MRRRLWHAATVVTLLIYLAVGCVWLWSNSRIDGSARSNGYGLTQCVLLHRGALYYFGINGGAGPGPISDWSHYSIDEASFVSTHARLRDMGQRRWSLLGLEYAWDASKSPGLSGTGYSYFRVPLWIVWLVVLTPIAITCCLSQFLRWRRYIRGVCPQCGYDLRATPQGCPECGWSK